MRAVGVPPTVVAAKGDDAAALAGVRAHAHDGHPLRRQRASPLNLTGGEPLEPRRVRAPARVRQPQPDRVHSPAVQTAAARDEPDAVVQDAPRGVGPRRGGDARGVQPVPRHRHGVEAEEFIRRFARASRRDAAKDVDIRAAVAETTRHVAGPRRRPRRRLDPPSARRPVCPFVLDPAHLRQVQDPSVVEESTASILAAENHHPRVSSPLTLHHRGGVPAPGARRVALDPEPAPLPGGRLQDPNLALRVHRIVLPGVPANHENLGPKRHRRVAASRGPPG